MYYLSLPNGNPFGYYAYLYDPHYVYHFDMGYEYVFDAADGKGGMYLYDFKSGGFFYTSPTFAFPYLYDFSLNTALYYYPDPGNHCGTTRTAYVTSLISLRGRPSQSKRGAYVAGRSASMACKTPSAPSEMPMPPGGTSASRGLIRTS